MMQASYESPQLVRSVFVSDVHLGCRHSQAESFLEFLKNIQPARLYLVGDFLDGWKAARLLEWNGQYHQIIQRLIEMAGRGTQIYYTPGNHDNFLRTNPFFKEMVDRLKLCEIREEFEFRTADGRRFLVTHGDRFDCYESTNRLSYFLGEVAYQSMLWTNRLAHRLLRRRDRTPYSVIGKLMRGVKRRLGFQQDFERQCTEYAFQNQYEGIICGHIHAPAIVQRNRITFCNIGDWVENCTALLEYADGSMELHYHFPAMRTATAVPKPDVPRRSILRRPSLLHPKA